MLMHFICRINETDLQISMIRRDEKNRWEICFPFEFFEFWPLKVIADYAVSLNLENVDWFEMQHVFRSSYKQ